ncbi:MAG: hypothetical protein SF069_03505 [Phycisphaerae bacterium]|nr:hypothetical protein [Phycisphaerae bacterium]
MPVDFLKLLSDPDTIAFRLRGRDWPRALLRGAEPVPEGWAALVESEQGAQRIFAPGSAIDVAPHDAVTLVRRTEHALTIALSATTADHETVETRCRLTIDSPFTAGDLASMAAWAASAASQRIDFDRVQSEVSQQLIDALQRHARQHDAAWLVDTANRATIERWLSEAARAIEFERGLRAARMELEQPRCPRLEQARAETRSFEQQQAAIARRTELERASRAAAAERLRETAAMLDRLRGEGGQRGLREILHATPTADRARLLSQLWHAGASLSTTSAIVAVGGGTLVVVALNAPAAAARRVPLPDSLGGLSAVHVDAERNTYWIGAERGLWRVSSLDDGTPPKAYSISASPRRRAGVNSIVIAAGRVYATHSGVGLWSWIIESPAPPDGDGAASRAEWTPSPNANVNGVRGATLLRDGRLAFAVDGQVFSLSPHAETNRAATPPVPFSPPAAARIRTLAASQDSLFAGLSDGAIASLPLSSPTRWAELDRIDGPVASLAVRRWFEIDELLIPAGRRGVVAHYGDGASATLLPAPATAAGAAPIDRVWAVEDVLVGLSQDLGRAYLLRRGEEAVAQVAIARLLGAAVEDICLVL